MALSILAMLAVIGAAVANLSSDWINTKANPYVQRSLQSILLHKKGEAIESIESSSRWRKELFNRAMDEWRSDKRIFWTGRATFGFGTADQTALLISGGYEAVIQSSLRRGATHNLISDLLVAYGVIGLILYLTVCAALGRFLWYVYRLRNLTAPAANLTLVTLVGSGSWFFYALLAGTFYPAEFVWFTVLLVTASYSGVAFEERRKPALAPRPPFRPAPQTAAIPVGRRRLVHTPRT